MKSILIVDDAVFMRTILKEILEKNNFQVVGEAENGKQSISMYRELKPDLVIMDITMPEMDGIEATSIIKEEFPESTVVMCSAMGQQAMVVEAIKAGATDFIVKPFQADRVVESINKILG